MAFPWTSTNNAIFLIDVVQSTLHFYSYISNRIRDTGSWWLPLRYFKNLPFWVWRLTEYAAMSELNMDVIYVPVDPLIPYLLFLWFYFLAASEWRIFCSLKLGKTMGDHSINQDDCSSQSHYSHSQMPCAKRSRINNTNVHVFGLTRPGIEPTNSRTEITEASLFTFQRIWHF